MQGVKLVDLPLFFGLEFAKRFNLPTLELYPFPHREYKFTGSLSSPGREYQQRLVDEMMEQLQRTRCTLLAAHPGAGKTVMGVAIGSMIAKHPILVVVHLTTLKNQWPESFELYSDAKVYNLSATRKSDNKWTMEEADVFIIMVGQIDKLLDPSQKISKIAHTIGTVIVDEAHSFCTSLRVQALMKIKCQYLIFMTATPKRGDGLETILDAFVGPERVIKKLEKPFHTYCIQTGIVPLRVPGNRGTNPTKFAQSLMYSEARNIYISQLVIRNLHRKILILLKEKRHGQILLDRLTKLGVKCATLMGNQTSYEDSNVLIGTVAKIGTAFDEKSFAKNFNGRRLDMLIMTVSYKDETVIEQNVGRILRADHPIVLYLLDKDKNCDRHWNAFRRWLQRNNGTFEKCAIDLPNETEDFVEEQEAIMKGHEQPEIESDYNLIHLD